MSVKRQVWESFLCFPFFVSVSRSGVIRAGMRSVFDLFSKILALVFLFFSFARQNFLLFSIKKAISQSDSARIFPFPSRPRVFDYYIICSPIIDKNLGGFRVPIPFPVPILSRICQKRSPNWCLLKCRWPPSALESENQKVKVAIFCADSSTSKQKKV